MSYVLHESEGPVFFGSLMPLCVLQLFGVVRFL